MVALKELRIRGDFGTSIDFLVSILESQEFSANSYSTCWLDALIAKGVRPSATAAVLDAPAALDAAAEDGIESQSPALEHMSSRSDVATALVCCAVHIAQNAFDSLFAHFGYTEKLTIS